MAHRRLTLGAALLALGLLVAACSPEASRSRGGGAGADVGNRTLGSAMDIHGQTDPHYQEPTAKINVSQERR
jgi:hypothetical protein